VNKTYVLDASALLVLLDDRPSARRVKHLIEEATRLKTTLLASVVNLGEVFYLSWQRYGEQSARDTLDDLSLLPLTILPVDSAQALKAAELRALHHVPYVDCLAAALSSIHQATLVTSDHDFERLGRHFPILWLTRP
jgi:predicted nucleic acid-binding protein